MKQDSNHRRMAAGRYLSFFLSLLSVYLTCAVQGLLPLPAFIQPLLAQMLLLPAMLLLAAGLNWRCFRRGICAILRGKPGRDSCAVLAAILAAGLCALGASSGAAGCAVLLLTVCSWMDVWEETLALPSGGGGWFFGVFAAAVCAAVFWIIRGNSVGRILERVLSLLAAASVCPFQLLAALCNTRAKHALPVSCASLPTVSALGTADTVLLIPDGLLTGAPAVSDIRPAGMDETDFLSLAASILRGSALPAAPCIAALAQSRGLTLQEPSKQEALPDGGWRAVIGGRCYFAGTQAQLQGAGIFAPRADELALAGKISVCFGMEGGMYLGRIALEHPVCPDAQDAMRALASQRLRLVLPCGEQPLYTRQLAARFGADVSETADALGQPQEEGTVLVISGEPQAKMQEQLPVLSLRTLADAPVCLRQCRHAVRAGRLLTGLSAALLVLLAGLAGGVFSPALDLGDRPLLCALLSLFITAASALLACIAVPSAPALHPEEAPPQPAQPQPEAVSAEASTTALRMDELPSVPGKATLEQALLDVPGVLTAEANYETGIILVTGTADKETLLRAIAEAASVKAGKQ